MGKRIGEEDRFALEEKVRRLVEEVRRDQSYEAMHQLGQLLYKPLSVILRNGCPPNLLDDIYQETWLRFIVKIKEGVKADSYIGYFIGIARYVKINIYKNELRYTELNDESKLLLNNIPSDSIRSVYAAQMIKKLRECLMSILPRYSLFLQGHVTDRDRNELCEELDVKVKNYNKFLHRARQCLFKCIGNGAVSLESV